MTRGSGVLAVVAVFLLGLLAGGFASHLYYAHSLEERSRRPPRERRVDLLTRLDRELHLTPDQHEEIRTLLDESHARAEELRREMAPRVREHVRASHDAIREVLTDEQRPGFDAMMDEMENRGRRMFLGPPGEGRRHRARRPAPAE